MSFSVVKWILLFGVVFGVIAVDQVTKNWVIDNLELYETYLIIPALHPYFQLTRSSNTGIAFGLGANNNELYLVLALIITLALLYFYLKSMRRDYLLQVSLALVIGGAVGNAIDRVQHGHVVDFIHYRLPDVFSNVSNLADHAIVFGVFLLIVDNILKERAEKRQIAADVTAPDD